MSRLVAVLLSAALAAAAFSREPLPSVTPSEARSLSSGEYSAVQESLRFLSPNIRFYKLDQLGLMPRTAASVSADSTGLRLVGKWGAGPSVKVTGRDSLVFLSRGSEVVAICYADTANPRILSYIEVNGLVSRSVLVGNRLYIGSTGSDPKYIDVFDVTDPASPQQLGHLQTRLLDIDVVDTLVYTVAKDLFRVFNFADPANPRQIGACNDTGYTLSACNGYAYVANPGLYVVDVRDPTNPHHLASWGSDLLSVKARGNICCATTCDINNYLTFYVLDTRQPASIAPLGSIDSCGGNDVYLVDSFVFLSGYYTNGHVFRVLDISDSTRPTSIGSCPTTHTHFGVWANIPASRAYVADDLEGLSVVDISNLTAPRLDTTMLAAGLSEDVAIQDSIAYVATDGCGLKILDISNPSLPHELGSVDSTRDNMTQTLAVKDSFAFIGWGWRPWLRSVNVLDPANPKKAGGVELFSFPRYLAVRDSCLYVAEDGRFQVVNVARPRTPALAGSCVLGNDSYSLDLADSLAYVATYPFSIIDVKDPSNPVITGTISRGAWNGSVSDSLLFLSSGGILVYSAARPDQPRLLDSLSVGPNTYWVVAVGTLLYTGNRDGVRVVDASDIHNMRVRGFCSTPYTVDRLAYRSPYIYAACWEAGVSIYESTQVAIAEPRQSEGGEARKGASVVRGVLMIGDRGQKTVDRAELLDAAGRKVLDLHPGANDVRALAPGVYFILDESDAANPKPQAIRKVILTR